MGEYAGTVAEFHVPYVRPCECGGREDVRWMEITDSQGWGLRVTGSAPFHFSALPWTVEQYDAADYQDQLGESQGVELTIDGFHAGLGGDTGWTKNIHPEYRIPQGNYLYQIALTWKKP
ncbi:glycoside hydrolase family 2 TIM barrel [Clostridium sp. CAG:1013]|nr:glycoside hydrolase family 2 TIM barrel [Clostridium sp. CAG:1013]